MCGFVGVLERSPTVSPLEREAIVGKMTAAVRHRGPDDLATWLDKSGNVAFGFCRLAILDLSDRGRQPMTSASSRFVVAYNGELYNWLALREELAGLGHVFRGRSDTEVLLASFEQWGVDAALERLVGMFAFAVWDAASRKLHLARDRFGEKPLYYGWQGHTFLFGSDLRALRNHPSFGAELDPKAIAKYLRFSYVPGPASIFRGIRKLMPGTTLSIDLDGSDDEPPARAYWTVRDMVRRARAQPFSGDEREAADSLEARLSDAVRQRMVADVPLGAFLSGGIDSSLIVALMQSHSVRPIRTFTIGFREQNYNEAEHARAVAAHLGTYHTDWYLRPADIIDAIPQMPAAYDEPFADSSQLPTLLVARLARGHVTVALSGDAGDELFGGYHRHFLVPRVWRALSWLPTPLRRQMARMILGFAPSSWDVILDVINSVLPHTHKRLVSGERLHKLASLFAAADVSQMYDVLVSAWQDPTEVIGAGGHDHNPQLANVSAHLEPAHRMMYRDLETYLVDDILVKVDRATMFVGLEARVPFLDHRLVEFAWTLPLHFKIRDGRGKWVVRKVLERYVPAPLFERPKAGFGIPVGQWLRRELRPWAEEMLDADRLKREGLFDPRPIRRTWEEHVNGGRDRQLQLWNLLMFETWLQESKAADKRDSLTTCANRQAS